MEILQSHIFNNTEILVLKSLNLVPRKDFYIDTAILDEYLLSYKSITGTKGIMSRKEISYSRKLAALTLLKYKKENCLLISEGFIYIISNPAWKDSVKVGMTVNPKQRLANYQTYSPKRDYELEHWSFWQARRKAEKVVHEHYKEFRNHEWVSKVATQDLITYLKNNSDS